MTVTTRYETVRAADGASFEAFCAVPDAGSGPGILLFQEIFSACVVAVELHAPTAADPVPDDAPLPQRLLGLTGREPDSA